MRVLEQPMDPGDLLWTVRVDHTDQAVSATTWRCPSQQSSSLWVQEEEGTGVGGFHPWREVSADSASLSLPGEPICCRELRKQLGAQGTIPWCSCWGRASGSWGSAPQDAFT